MVALRPQDPLQPGPCGSGRPSRAPCSLSGPGHKPCIPGHSSPHRLLRSGPADAQCVAACVAQSTHYLGLTLDLLQGGTILGKTVCVPQGKTQTSGLCRDKKLQSRACRQGT